MLFFIQSDIRGFLSDGVIESRLSQILISGVRRRSYAVRPAMVRSSVTVEMGGIYQLHEKKSQYPVRNRV